MGRLIDLTGQKIGKLTVVKRAENTNHGAARWLCKCDCGNFTVVIGDELRKGSTRSCGCLAREITSNRMKCSIPCNKTHDKTGTHIYKVWQAMKRRCNNPSDNSYDRYGGRGISVCECWQNSFEKFYDYVSKLPHFEEKGYTINRINNNGNYEPNNVEWADDTTQANNRRTNRCVVYNGKQYTIAQLAKMYKMPYKKLYKRLIQLQWNIEKSLNTP